MEATISPLLDFLWTNRTSGHPELHGSTYRQRLQALFALGITLEDALCFIHEHQPDDDTFLAWVEQRKRVYPAPAASPDVLSAEDLAFWNENGYVVVRNAVDPDMCREACHAIWKSLDASPDVPQSWYRVFENSRGMMLRFSDHPSLDVLRNSPRILKAYRQLYGHERIFKTIDKTSFNPPVTKEYAFAGSRLHWDVSLHLPVADEFQGLLYLTPTTEHDGAFHCVPGFHRSLGDWLQTVPAGLDAREYALKELQPVPVPGNAGDFVIWHQALPHCATPNTGTLPRIVLYLTYLPEGNEEPEIWI